MGWVVNATPWLLYPQERPGTHCIGGWVGTQGRSGRVQKISPSPGFDPLTVQPVASHYTDCVIPAHVQLYVHDVISQCRVFCLLYTSLKVAEKDCNM
jgi:hypothetical protein